MRTRLIMGILLAAVLLVVGGTAVAYGLETTATPVSVVDTVTVQGSVGVTGSVEASITNPVQVYGTVSLAGAPATVTGSVTVAALGEPLLGSFRRLAAFCAFLVGFGGGYAWVRRAW